MKAYIEFIHNIIGGNCEHKITVYESIQKCKNKHDDCANLYEFEIPANCDGDDEQWLVFVFYEYMVVQANVYSTRKEAFVKFDKESQAMTPNDECSKIIEWSSENEMICSLYLKNNGSYTLPDKAKRVAMVMLPAMNETKYV